MKRELLKEYLLDNTDVMRHIVVELNSWDGSLEDLQVWENDEEFFNTFFYNNPSEVARAISFGDYNYYDDRYEGNAAFRFLDHVLVKLGGHGGLVFG